MNILCFVLFEWFVGNDCWKKSEVELKVQIENHVVHVENENAIFSNWLVVPCSISTFKKKKRLI